MAKKNMKRVSYSMRSDVADALQEYSEETGIPKTRIIEQMLENNLPNFRNRKNKQTKEE